MIDAEHYQRVLGDELRKLRRGRGWTRKELNAHLQSEISLQTLATYELGTRQCSVVRLVELCVAMDELPQDLLAKVHSRVFTEEPGRVRVDLRRVVAEAGPELTPLRRWAEGRLRQNGVALPARAGTAARPSVPVSGSPAAPSPSAPAASGQPASASASTDEVSFDFAALERMAELCGLPTAELVSHLRKLAPA
ncbi:helix-turn-helix domain-containing protein [Amycolatopsis rubida]|uniref:Helix-turn-helix domain-containing protein n=1 Tax=Amycolatopsis rubida TaxID=112413 RepID=A0ABX0BZM2_9PSEU|nr:helix-turn-helix domain-containing protein [Amycolatopsis sp. M39]MYW94958.1 helix-turn-helix domain-containing protein [Amycolatopsis rubida]NEC59945.1 helix-turn-helix domain-containing protein [Amycolatopsis rubida]OAP25681.1 anaerobic benzoate catabolism transcriptional regulator [Amycolatopsis sp. M39]